MGTVEQGLIDIVHAGVRDALAPFLQRLGDPEPIVYSIPQAAVVLATSPHTVRRLIDEGHLPIVPHMGERRLIPRQAVHAFVEAAS